MDTSVNSAAPAGTRVAAARWSALAHRWPSVVGLAAATLVLANGANRETLATIVSVAALCYLGAAAFDRPWVAWAGVGGASVVVVVSELAGLPWWVGIAVVAGVLVVVGLVGRVPRPALTAQTLALLGYGGLAVAALHLAPPVGLVLAGVALTAHGIWDVIHYRRNQVVPRSLAEFCVLLDVPLGIGFLVLAAIG
ncbi:hypothetical protein [Polymorphospora rubra]|uniref:hypothetical protein n=1 Tax=Polymorphospora rubra TaxID=338584 RepID=UPI001BB2F5D9|nr:hypothetical protein [Polymorphospora rubra]